MVETERQTDLNGLLEKLVELQEALLQAQERNISLAAQVRELDKVARDHEEMKVDLDNQTVLLTEKSRENKYLQQELSRMSSLLNSKLSSLGDLKAQVQELQHQLKTVQQERDLLAVMLTEAENAQRQTGSQPAAKDSNWTKYFKGKQV